MKQTLLLYICTFILAGLLQFTLQQYANFLGYRLNKIGSILFLSLTSAVISYLAYLYPFNYTFFKYALLIEVLMTISLIDTQYKIIPDPLNKVIALLGLINLIVTRDYYNILAFLLAGSFFLGIALISKGGMGGGDIKMIASLGLIMGILPIIYIIKYSFIFAAVAGVVMILLKKKTFSSAIAMGPYISLGTLVLLVSNGI